MVWGKWAIRDPNCRWEVLRCPVDTSGLNAAGKEGDLSLKSLVLLLRWRLAVAITASESVTHPVTLNDG